MTECDAEWNHVALRLAYMYSHADLDSMVRPDRRRPGEWRNPLGIRTEGA